MELEAALSGVPAWGRTLALLTQLRASRVAAYASALGVRGLEALGKFGLYFLAARQLGGHDSGLLFFCLTWSVLTSSAARMGMERALTRHIAAELAVGQGLAARAALLQGLGWTSLGALAWAGFTFALAQPLASHVFGQADLGPPLRYAALLLLPQTLGVAVAGALTGLGRGALAQLISNALPPGLALGLLLAGVSRLDHVLLAYAGCHLAPALLGLGVLLHDRHRFTNSGVPMDGSVASTPLPRMWHTALPFLTVEMISVGMTSLPLLLLGAFADAQALGAFSVASRLSILVWTIIISMGSIAAPRFAAHFHREEWTELASMNRLARRLTALACLGPLLVMLFFPGWLLGLIGPAFVSGATALVVMSVGQAVNAALPLQDVLLGMTGHGRALRRISLMQLATGVVAGGSLIPWLGGLGAGITTALCIALGAVLTSTAARRMVPRAF